MSSRELSKITKKAPPGKFIFTKKSDEVGKAWKNAMENAINNNKNAVTKALEALGGGSQQAYRNGVCRFFIAKGFIPLEKLEDCKEKASETNNKWLSRTKDKLQDKDKLWEKKVRSKEEGDVGNKIAGGIKNAMDVIKADYDSWLSSVLNGMYTSIITGIQSRKGKRSKKRKEREKEKKRK